MLNNREVLGHAIREFRKSKGLSIAAVAREVPLSESTLQRVETGAATLRDADIARLDLFLNAGGGLITLHRSLEGTVQPPLYSFHRSTSEAGHQWPAGWAGVVWVFVRALEPAAAASSTVDLTWGPWRVRHEWTGGDILLETGKESDNVSVGIRVQLSHPADVIFGTGEISPRPAALVNLRNNWHRDD